MSTEKFRLITRSDFDGLICAVLLREMDMIDEIKFVHPKDMQDGKIEVTDRDITTNLPYVPGVHLAFDHHLSETERKGFDTSNHIIDPLAASAARVVFNHFGGPGRFPNIPAELMAEVDRADSAQYSYEDIVRPNNWTLLNFIMDPRTGLGRFRNFRISNYELMMELIEAVRASGIDDVLRHPDVVERTSLYFDQQPLFRAQLRRVGKVHGPLVELDLRDEEMIHAGNRFMVYALFPECSVSMHVMWGLNKQNTVFACGRSIIDRSHTVEIGPLMLKYGGGGHAAAGTCQIANEDADRVRGELIAALSQG